ncbi:hypothetical protein D3C78_1309320 [compost metagenome]
MFAQFLRGFIAEFAAQVRALQVAVAIGGGAVQQQAVASAFGQLGAQSCRVEGQVYGIAGLRVGVLKVQLSAGRQTGAGASQGDARRCQATQFL